MKRMLATVVITATRQVERFEGSPRYVGASLLLRFGHALVTWRDYDPLMVFQRLAKVDGLEVRLG